MEKNFKVFLVKSAVLLAVLVGVTFLFRFPIDFFNLKMFSMNEATRIFSKSDAMKIMALALLFFALYFKERISRISHEKQNYGKSAFLVFAGIIAVSGYYFLRYVANVNNIDGGAYFYFIYSASIILLGVAFAFFSAGVFSFGYLKKIYKEFTLQIWITAGLTVAAYFLLMLFQSLWPYFSYSITIIQIGRAHV